MPKFVLDGIEYNSEDLDDKGNALLTSMKFSENKIRALNAEINVFQTAKTTYLNELKSELVKFSKSK